MNSQKALRRLGCGLILIGAAFAWQRPFRVYPSMEPYDDIPLPGDWQDKSEWVFGRLMYPAIQGAGWRSVGNNNWTIDYPRSDRHLSAAVRTDDNPGNESERRHSRHDRGSLHDTLRIPVIWKRTRRFMGEHRPAGLRALS